MADEQKKLGDARQERSIKKGIPDVSKVEMRVSRKGKLMKEQDNVTNKNQILDSFMIHKEGLTEDQCHSTKGAGYGKEIHIDNKAMLEFMEELMKKVKEMRKEFKQSSE
ncbi:hypothetical protein QLX08_004375 [Tetragonisca angustula]|uniref:Uncharacterized protein n=1 Tax=Tetragonisca angustula TaxID=166442 RepID=A0AAW1A2S0_9HYME